MRLTTDTTQLRGRSPHGAHDRWVACTCQGRSINALYHV